MYCSRCGVELEPAANFCKSCGQPTSASPASSRSAEIPSERGRAKHGRQTVLNVVACIAAAGAILIIIGYAAGTGTQSLAAAVGSAALSAAYALVLFKRDRRSLTISWIMVVLLGLGTVLGGLVPVMIVVWALLLWFTVYLRKHRDALVQ